MEFNSAFKGLMGWRWRLCGRKIQPGSSSNKT